MKSIKFVLATAILLVVTACSSTQTSQEKIDEVSRKIQNRDFIIDVSRVNPQRGRMVHVTSPYSLTLRNDSAFAHLPYFGVVHSNVPYGGEGGVKFEEPVTDYFITTNKKNDGWDIKFKVRKGVYSYDISMNVFNNGSATFVVMPSNGDSNSYSGEVK